MSQLGEALFHVSKELAMEIEASYLPEDMDQCADALIALSKSGRALAAINLAHAEVVEKVVEKITDAVVQQPHYRCDDCHTVFIDEKVLHRHNGGDCPVCNGKVRRIDTWKLTPIPKRF